MRISLRDLIYILTFAAMIAWMVRREVELNAVGITLQRCSHYEGQAYLAYKLILARREESVADTSALQGQIIEQGEQIDELRMIIAQHIVRSQK